MLSPKSCEVVALAVVVPTGKVNKVFRPIDIIGVSTQKAKVEGVRPCIFHQLSLLLGHAPHAKTLAHAVTVFKQNRQSSLEVLGVGEKISTGTLAKTPKQHLVVPGNLLLVGLLPDKKCAKGRFAPHKTALRQNWGHPTSVRKRQGPKI